MIFALFCKPRVVHIHDMAKNQLRLKFGAERKKSIESQLYSICLGTLIVCLCGSKRTNGQVISYPKDVLCLCSIYNNIRHVLRVKCGVVGNRIYARMCVTGHMVLVIAAFVYTKWAFCGCMPIMVWWTARVNLLLLSGNKLNVWQVFILFNLIFVHNTYTHIKHNLGVFLICYDIFDL